MPAAFSQPPAVRYPFDASRRLAWAPALLSASGAAVVLAWLALQRADVPQSVLGVLLWAACSGLAWQCWRAAPSGELVWDGLRWLVRIGARDDEPCAPPCVCADVPPGLWVRLVRQGGAVHWVWLARGADPLRWLDLRRALFACQGRQARPVAGAAPEGAS